MAYFLIRPSFLASREKNILYFLFFFWVWFLGAVAAKTPVGWNLLILFCLFHLSTSFSCCDFLPVTPLCQDPFSKNYCSSLLCPQGDSNFHPKLRKLVFYPLNYGGDRRRKWDSNPQALAGAAFQERWNTVIRFLRIFFTI